MYVPAAWTARLRQQEPPIAMLLTVAPLASAMDRCCHLALVPGALRLGTTRAFVESAATNVPVPFWPFIRTWPEIEYRISPHERRAETTTFRASAVTAVDFPFDAVGRGGAGAMVAELDLWMPGLSLEEVIPLAYGPVREAEFSRRDGTIDLTAADEPVVDAAVDARTLQNDDFPDLPPFNVGQPRLHVFGFTPEYQRTQAFQIDSEGRRFYLCEGELVRAPRRFYIEGYEITTEAEKPAVLTVPFATDPSRVYTELRFARPIRQTAIVGILFASDFVGPGAKNPIDLLLTGSQFGNYELDSGTAGLLHASEEAFDYNVFLRQGSVLDVVQQRLLPQTDLMMHFQNGKPTFYKLLQDGPERSAEIGTGLMYRIGGSQTDDADVQNVVDVKYARTPTAPIGADEVFLRDSLTVDRSYGGSIGSLLSISEQTYGRRKASAPIDAADLVSTDPNAAIPAAVVRLAEVEARLNAFQHRVDQYAATYSYAFGLQMNQRVWLTDPDEGYDEEPVRLVGWRPMPGVAYLTFQTEDAG